MANKSFKGIVAVLVVVALFLVTWSFLTMPDQRTTGERIGDAVDALPQGVDKAAKQLEERTPGEKLGDAVKDAGEDIRQSTDSK